MHNIMLIILSQNHKFILHHPMGCCIMRLGVLYNSHIRVRYSIPNGNGKIRGATLHYPFLGQLGKAQPGCLLVLYYMNSGSLGQIIFHWSNAPTLLHYTLWLGMSIVVIYKPSPAFRHLYFEAHNMHICIYLQCREDR